MALLPRQSCNIFPIATNFHYILCLKLNLITKKNHFSYYNVEMVIFLKNCVSSGVYLNSNTHHRMSFPFVRNVEVFFPEFI